MKRDEKDKDDLKRFAHALSDLLKRHTSTPRRRWQLQTAEEDGWHAAVSTVRSRLDIEIFLDRILDKKARGYWVGFTSRDEKDIISLVPLG